MGKKIVYNSLKSKNSIAIWDIVVLLLALLSCLSGTLYILFYVFLFAYGLLGVQNGLKALTIAPIRKILSKAVAVALPNSLIAWAFMLGLCFYILLFAKLNQERGTVYKKIVSSTSVFCLYVIISSFITGSYPVISLAKVMVFYICFLAIMKGIASLSDINDLVNFICLAFLIVFLISAIIAPVGRFRIVNGSFQGIINHPNMFGILCPVFLSLLLLKSELKNRAIVKALMIFLIVFLCYLCKSRTGLMSSIAVLIANYSLSEKSKNKKALIVSCCIIGALVLLVLDTETQSFFNTFLYKGRTTDILYSRRGQFDGLINKFQQNKLLGSGFMVPYINGFRSYVFSFDMVAEPGNLILELLGDVGIIGSISFFALFFVILKAGKIKNVYLLIGALLLNMGEMVFFSTNNIAILVYIPIALYLFGTEVQMQ